MATNPEQTLGCGFTYTAVDESQPLQLYLQPMAAITGQFVGRIKDTNGNPIRIDQLWGIKFGGGTSSNGGMRELFFTAGPDNNLAGTFGVIRVSN